MEGRPPEGAATRRELLRHRQHPEYGHEREHRQLLSGEGVPVPHHRAVAGGRSQDRFGAAEYPDQSEQLQRYVERRHRQRRHGGEHCRRHGRQRRQRRHECWHHSLRASPAGRPTEILLRAQRDYPPGPAALHRGDRAAAGPLAGRDPGRHPEGIDRTTAPRRLLLGLGHQPEAPDRRVCRHGPRCLPGNRPDLHAARLTVRVVHPSADGAAVSALVRGGRHSGALPLRPLLRIDRVYRAPDAGGHRGQERHPAGRLYQCAARTRSAAR